MKRVISVLLALLILTATLPLSVFAGAEGDDTAASMYTDSYDLSGIDGVGNVLVKAASADEEPDDVSYSFSYLSVTGKTASVGLNNSEACTLVVAVYSEEDGQMLGSGNKEIAANTFETTVEIKIDEMPEYFILKAFMLDENMMALCKPFSVIEYSEQFAIFDRKTVDDFDDSVIINFDEREDENFAVLVDGAKETVSSADNNTLVSYDKETGKYVFSNCDDSLTSLSEGDVLEFGTDDDLYLLKVKSVKVSGSTVTVTEDQDASHSDYFQYIDIDLSSAPDGSDITVDMTNADDNIVYDGIAQWDNEETASLNPKMKAELVDVDDTWSSELKWTILEKYLVGDEDSDFSVKVSGEIKAALDFNIRIYYDANWEWRWDFWNSYSDYFYCQVRIDFKITGSVTLTGAVAHDFKLGEIDFVTPAGIIIDVDVNLHVEASLSVSIVIDFITITVGFRYDEESGFRNLCSGPEIKLLPKLEGNAEIKVGVKLGPGISFVKVIEISLEPEGGAKLTLNADTLDPAELLKITKPDSIHTCAYLNCFNGDIRLYLSCDLTGRIFNKSKDIKIAPECTWKLCDCNLKIVPFKFSLSLCPNTAYRCDITVTDTDDNPLENVSVNAATGLCDADGNNKYEETETVTDENGKTVFYFPSGVHNVTFSAEGYPDQTVSIHVLQDTKTIDIKMKKSGYSATGKVVDEDDGTALSGVTVKIIRDSDGTSQTTTTDDGGGFRFFVEEGRYHFEFYANNYESKVIDSYISDAWDAGIIKIKKNTNRLRQYKGHYYQVFDVTLPWGEAKSFCENLGGHLLCIEDSGEQEFVNTLINDGTKEFYWIGGYRVEREWFWITEPGSAMTYTNWAEDEPKSILYPDGEYKNEDSIELYRSGEWNDEEHDGAGSSPSRLTQHGLICEWDRKPQQNNILNNQKTKAPLRDELIYTAEYDKALVGAEYVLLVVRDATEGDLFIDDNLLYIDQITATEETVKFNYVLSEEIPGATALIFGPDRDSHVHTFSKWTIQKPATLSEEGLKIHTCIVCGFEETCSFTLDESLIIGDIDGNGQILADDARLALRFSAKLEDLSEAQQLAADVDGNGQVLADDARQILRFSAKLQLTFDKA
ncbi:MAG: carboxypeptidase regulatory-like domain-containing protein [Clostridia bacterium]|nr:carboxypeptidase regulatory-like domain-containing protein [Clostridia bacterium]